MQISAADLRRSLCGSFHKKAASRHSGKWCSKNTEPKRVTQVERWDTAKENGYTNPLASCHLGGTDPLTSLVLLEQSQD